MKRGAATSSPWLSRSIIRSCRSFTAFSSPIETGPGGRGGGVRVDAGARGVDEGREVHRLARHLEAHAEEAGREGPLRDVVDVDPEVAGVVPGHGAFEERVELAAVGADREALGAAARGEVRALGVLAVGDLQERVLRRPHARELDRRLEDAAVRRDVEEERAELLAHPEGPVGRADERLRVEVEAGQDPRRRVGAARRRSGRERVEGEAGKRRAALRVADDRPRDAGGRGRGGRPSRRSAGRPGRSSGDRPGRRRAGSRPSSAARRSRCRRAPTTSRARPGTMLEKPWTGCAAR